MQAIQQDGLEETTGKRPAALGRRALMFSGTLVLLGTLAGGALGASTNFVEPPTSPEAAGVEPNDVVAADLDGDGDRDLAVVNSYGRDVTILRNNGAGDFAEAATSPEGVRGKPLSLAAADLDGDGDKDLAVAAITHDEVVIMLNRGNGNFDRHATGPEPAGDGARSVAAADFDGDSDLDLAVANYYSDNVTILRNSGAADFAQPATSPEPAGNEPVALDAADFDGDADLDLVIANASSDNVTILRNDGAANFIQPPSSPEPAGNGPFSVATADFDGDSDTDLAVTSYFSNNVTILRNGGAGAFSEPATSPEPAGNGPLSVAAANFDGDADQDLAVANASSDNVTILRNNAIANFAQPASSPEPAGNAPLSVIAADLDGDGDPDLAAANGYSDNVTILLNR